MTDAPRAASPDTIRSRPFPILRGIGVRGTPPDPHPTQIPWSVAEKAYGVYSDRYGRSQSLERLAERGGFSAGEMDTFHPGWRDEVSEIVALRAEVDRVRGRAEHLEGLLRMCETEIGFLDETEAVPSARSIRLTIRETLATGAAAGAAVGGP